MRSFLDSRRWYDTIRCSREEESLDRPVFDVEREASNDFFGSVATRMQFVCQFG